jgi:hypothetical protein
VLAGTLRENLLLTAPGRDRAELLAALDAVNLGDWPARPESAWTRRWARAACCSPAASGSGWRSPATAGRRADPAAGRADEQPRRPQRGRPAAAIARRPAVTVAHDDHRGPPAVDGDRRRPDRRARRRSRGRHRPARRAARRTARSTGSWPPTSSSRADLHRPGSFRAVSTNATAHNDG